VIAVAAIEQLPVRMPTEFIVGTAGMGSIILFAAGVALRITRFSVRERSVDPLVFAGYGAGIAGNAATVAWLLSLAWEVLFKA
jgi:hypothetical protein